MRMAIAPKSVGEN